MPPATIRSATTAHCTRSPRYFGRMTPRLTAPTWWPARPTRCSPLATHGGDSTWTTRSTAPMSMPSSRLEVATTAGSRPAFSASSICARCSRDTEPWWARAISTMPCASAPCPLPQPRTWPPARDPTPTPPCPMCCAGPRENEAPSGFTPAAAERPVEVDRLELGRGYSRSVAISLSRLVSRSASRRLLLKTIVERCCSTRSTMRSSTAGQMLARGSRARRASRRAPARSTRRAPPCPRPGRRPAPRSSWSLGGCTTTTSRVPPRKRATSSIGRTVADSPMRCAGSSSSASRRSSDSARWAPRLVPLTACTSSTITVSTPRSDSRAAEVRTRNSDSGVVMKTSGGTLLKRRRSSAGVSPERMPTAMSGTGRSRRWRGLADAGERRAQVALDVDGERLERADVQHPAAVPRLLGDGRAGQPVERPQERRQRLAAAGRRDDQGVPAGGDGVPGALLRGRRRREGTGEPRPRRGGEAVQGAHRSMIPRGGRSHPSGATGAWPATRGRRSTARRARAPAPRPSRRRARPAGCRPRGPRARGATTVCVSTAVPPTTS